MHNPAPAGKMIGYYIDEHNISMDQAVQALLTTEPKLAALIRGDTRIDSLWAAKLAKAFSTSVEFWLQLQMQHDAWIARANYENTLLSVNVLV